MLKHRLPATASLNEYAQAGMLMSYGPNLPDLFRRAASYVAKILRGAKALGLTIPQSLLLRADEVIQ